MTNFIDLEAIAQQGPVFWVACLAVAVGLAMIAAATVVQTRRLGQRISRRTRPESTNEPTPVVANQEPARVTIPRPRETTDTQEGGPRVESDHVARRLEGLLGRLGKVADRLDLAGRFVSSPAGVESAQNQTPQPPGESDLKGEGQGVEYVFRAAGG